ncbi:MAG: polysaccharide deacetylase family protein [Deltaproteobacteria bacterium]|nr:polysaccharide deacetylase family protein [Deltaproteobacteria bacterium]MBW2071267.1 polysaccharide deacetylase family protein [Deltaproteobacteria bacterium]
MWNRLWRSSNSAVRPVIVAAAVFVMLLCPPLRGEGSAFCLWPSTPLSAEEAQQLPTFQSEKTVVYVVKQGDSLPELAQRFYGDPQKGWLINQANDGVELLPGQVLVIPLEPSNLGGLQQEGYQLVPVLTYHHFSRQCKTALCMPIDKFSDQMAFLKRQGYHTVSMKQVLRFLSYEEPLPPKAIAITIDDGYSSVYDLAYPVLQRLGFKATLFIYTDFINSSSNALSWNQLKELAEAGFEIESHTLSHADLTRKKPGESDAGYLARVRRELVESRRLIKKKVGQEAVWLAYPYGRFNDLVITMAKQAGYRGGVSVMRGTNPFFADPFKVKRYQVFNSVSKQSLLTMLKTFARENLQ